MAWGALFQGLASETAPLSEPARGTLCYAWGGYGEGWIEEEKRRRSREELEKGELGGGRPSSLPSTFTPPVEMQRKEERD